MQAVEISCDFHTADVAVITKNSSRRRGIRPIRRKTQHRIASSANANTPAASKNRSEYYSRIRDIQIAALVVGRGVFAGLKMP